MVISKQKSNMTQEQKHLLLVDLCARQPYGVKISFGKTGIVLQLASISQDHCFPLNNSHILINKEYPIQWCKPYLRPMSSMTEEERMEFSKLLDVRYCEEDWEGHISTSYCIEIDNVYTDDKGIIKYPSSFSMDAIDWLNEHHFDYRGLIEKGLALEAPEDMYKSK